MRSARYPLALAAWCFVCAAAPGGTENVPATITVRPRKLLGPVPRLVFGHNVEAADTKDIFTRQSNPIMGQTGDGVWDPARRRPVGEVVRMARELGVSMIRYPGGCLTHNFDWKKAVGPAEKRPNFTFGVDEFIRLCRAVGAEPLMNVSAYVGGPAEAGQLVEYLNAPADEQHPWAQQRAASGHVEPHGVKYFEMGNESDHGNHDVKPFRKHTPAAYARWFNGCAGRMRKIDPSIRIGAHMGTGTGPDDPWNRHVLAATKGRADFVIVHTYAVGLWDPQNNNPLRDKADLLMRACLAAGEQTEAELARYRELIRQAAGRDLPLAITEYNASFVQSRPMPYRFSFGAALFSADYVRILLKPQTNVLMANYWHLVNGYWGMFRGPRRPGREAGKWKRLPAWYLYRLWGRHFGSRLVDVSVESPRLPFEGCLRVRPASKGGGPGGDAGFEVTATGGEAKGCRWRPTGKGSLRCELKDYDTETYHTLGSIAAKPGATYRLSHEGRMALGGPVKARLGVDLIDGRGWDATRSGCATQGVEATTEWKRFSTKMVTLPDCKRLDAHLRLIAKGTGGVSGTLEIRSLRVERLADPPPYAVLTASASLSEDGRTLYLIVFNKHHAADIVARIAVTDGSTAGARAWTVTGPKLTCTNLDKPEVVETVSGTPVAGAAGGGFTHRFPARSMTALEIARR